MKQKRRKMPRDATVHQVISCLAAHVTVSGYAQRFGVALATARKHFLDADKHLQLFKMHCTHCALAVGCVVPVNERV